MTIAEVPRDPRATFLQRALRGRTLFEYDEFWAALIAALIFAIYVSTLAPGVIGIVDTPKFQFIGRILGVSHNPGYPLYSVVTHFFGYLPVGSLAYRINLFSAMFGGLLGGVAYLLARALGCTRVIASAAVIAFACGSAVWSVSTVAEVYTLHVFVIASILLALVRWRQTGRASTFYLAVLLFAIGEGHHTDIVLMLPAIAVYACTVAPRFALRARTILASAAISVAGLLQYGFIILRTRQGAYVESPARNVSELFDIVRGRQFSSALLPVDVSMLLHDRVPLLGRIFAQEVSAVGLVLALVGIIVLARHRRRDAVLLGLTLVAFAGFGLVYNVADVSDFMIPAYLAAWIFAGIGATAIARSFQMRAGSIAAGAATAAFVLLPIYTYAHNREGQDLSHRWAPVRFLDGLFSNLPDGWAVLHEDFLVDRMIYYKTLGEGVLQGRRVLAPFWDDYDNVAALSRTGYNILAFQKNASLLRLQGADFAYTPYQVLDGSLDRLIDDLPRRSIVAIAIPAARYEAFAQSVGARLGRIGGNVPSAVVENAAMIGVAGTSTPSEDAHALKSAGVHVLRGAEIGSTGQRAPVEISAEASQLVASIKIGPREILRTGGVAIAVWDPQGTLLQAFALPNGDGRVPARPEGLRVFRLRRLRSWDEIPSTAADISKATASGNLVLRLAPPRSSVVFYLGRSRPLVPALFDMTVRQVPPFNVMNYTNESASRTRLTRDLATDGFPEDARLLRSSFVYRVTLSTPGDVQAPVALQLGLGGLPDVGFARTTEGPATGYFAVDLSTHLEPIDPHTERLHMARDQQAQLVGSGWSGVETDDFGAYRRMREPEAELLIPFEPNTPIRLSVQAFPGSVGVTDGTPLELVFNGNSLGVQAFEAGWKRYDWEVPGNLVQAVNSVVVKAPAAGAEISDVLVITP